MKPLFFVWILFFLIIGVFSCGKEKSFESYTSVSSSGTLKSASGECLPSILNGTFKAGQALTTTDYIEVQVEVIKAGEYLIVSDTVNGFSFKAEGTFTDQGLNTVHLVGTGTPDAAVTNTFSITYGTSTCLIDIPVIPGAGSIPAVYTLSGAPGACVSPVISGTYEAGVSLTSANTIAVKVDVTTAGNYTLNTNTVNGISFSATGFLAAGPGQTVLLKGSGTPENQGVSTFTPQFGTSACAFDVTIAVAPPVAPGVFTCKIDGVLTTFNNRASASTDDGFGGMQLALEGYTDPANGANVSELQIFITNNNGSGIKAHTYDVDGYMKPDGYRLEIDYVAVNADESVTRWNTSSTLILVNPPFTVIVTSVTATRVTGTFSGKITDFANGGTTQKTISEGVFDLPFK